MIVEFSKGQLTVSASDPGQLQGLNRLEKALPFCHRIVVRPFKAEGLLSGTNYCRSYPFSN